MKPSSMGSGEVTLTQHGEPASAGSEPEDRPGSTSGRPPVRGPPGAMIVAGACHPSRVRGLWPPASGTARSARARRPLTAYHGRVGRYRKIAIGQIMLARGGGPRPDRQQTPPVRRGSPVSVLGPMYDVPGRSRCRGQVGGLG